MLRLYVALGFIALQDFFQTLVFGLLKTLGVLLCVAVILACIVGIMAAIAACHAYWLYIPLLLVVIVASWRAITKL